MPRKGETPGKGKYVCLYCGTEVELHEHNDELPDCPQCNNFLFY